MGVVKGVVSNGCGLVAEGEGNSLSVRGEGEGEEGEEERVVEGTLRSAGLGIEHIQQVQTLQGREGRREGGRERGREVVVHRRKGIGRKM